MWLHLQQLHANGIEINACRAKSAFERSRLVQRALSGSPDARALGELRLLASDVRTVGLGNASHVFMSDQCWPEPLLHSLFRRLSVEAAGLECIVSFANHRPYHWSRRVERLADGWGHVVGVQHVPTTWGGASAIFLRKGKCSNGAERCSTMAEALDKGEWRKSKGRGMEWRPGKRRLALASHPSLERGGQQ